MQTTFLFNVFVFIIVLFISINFRYSSFVLAPLGIPISEVQRFKFMFEWVQFDEYTPIRIIFAYVLFPNCKKLCILSTLVPFRRHII